MPTWTDSNGNEQYEHVSRTKRTEPWVFTFIDAQGVTRVGRISVLFDNAVYYPPT